MKSRFALLAAAVVTGLFLAGPADAQMVFKPVDWRAQPGAGDLAAAYPAGEIIAGFQAFGCRIGDDGGLSRCRPVTDPNIGGEAFAEAATSLLPLYRVAPDAPGRMADKGLYVEVPVYLTPSGGRPVAPPPGRAREAMVFRPAEWTAEPTAKALEAAYPGGRDGPHMPVNFTCIVGAEGELTDCVVHRNSFDAPPAFVKAARRLLPLYRVERITASGLETPGLFINMAVSLNNPDRRPPVVVPGY